MKPVSTFQLLATYTRLQRIALKLHAIAPRSLTAGNLTNGSEENDTSVDWRRCSIDDRRNALWFFHATKRYVEVSGDRDTLRRLLPMFNRSSLCTSRALASST